MANPTTSTGIQTSFTKTPQAGDDLYNLNEDGIVTYAVDVTHQNVMSLDVMSNDLGGNAKLIAKLEKPEAIDDLAKIIDTADGVMVARGDLAVETSTERVPVLQKQIIAAALQSEKMIITATQMLQSMIENPRPTRAEASDVSNAVLDGSDAVMLSGETAVGRYPVASVLMMDRIIRSTEAAC